MARPRFTIIGSGRSGTGYMAKLMQVNGLRCGHEGYYNPIHFDGGSQDESLDGDSSWLALPYLEQDPHGVVIHVTRDPVAVVKSLLSIRFFHPETEQAPFPRFIQKHSSIFDYHDPVKRSVEFWVEWNSRCREIAHRTMRIEKLDYPGLSFVLNHRITPRGLSNRINHEPASLHAGRQTDPTSTEEIIDLLAGRQKPFGYSVSYS